MEEALLGVVFETKKLDCAVIRLQQLESNNHECEIPGVTERAEKIVDWAYANVEELAASCFKMLSRSFKEKVGDDSLMTSPTT